MLIILYKSIIYKSAFNQASILILEYCSTYISDQKSLSFSHDIPVASTSLFSLKLLRRRSLSGHTEWLYVRHPDTQFFYSANGHFFNIAIIFIVFLMELWPPEFLSRLTKYIPFLPMKHYEGLIWGSLSAYSKINFLVWCGVCSQSLSKESALTLNLMLVLTSTLF